MTNEDKQKMFESYRRVAGNTALRFARKYGFPVAELEDEAMSIVGLVLAEWEGSGVEVRKPYFWLYHNLEWSLSTYCLKRMKARQRARGSDKLDKSTARTGWLEGLMRDLGEDARALVETILQAPTEIAADLAPRTRRRGRAAIHRYMEEKQGWSPTRIATAWQEVEVAL